MKPLTSICVVVTVAIASVTTTSFASSTGIDPEELATKIDSTVDSIPIIVDDAQEKVMETIGMTTEKTDSAEFARLPWTIQLYKSGFNINAPGINYPKFPRLVVNIYNWADQFFNGFDPEYVRGTGYNFKAYAKSYNWLQSYGLYFSKDNYLRIRSKMYSDIGPNISYKAVTIGYMADLSELGHKKLVRRKNFHLDFTCGLFSAKLNIYDTKGATKITHMGNHSFHGGGYNFDGVNEKSTEFTAYYFFNHRKYSQGAAYNMSRHQFKSSGSWILGLNANHQRIDLDFSILPDDMFERLHNAMPDLNSHYYFRYNSFNLVGGYGYNWVLSPGKWLINVTGMPMIGYLHSFEGTTEGRKDLLSTNFLAMGSLVYNHRALFATAQLDFQGNLMFTKGYTFFNSLSSFSAIVGVRF